MKRLIVFAFLLLFCLCDVSTHAIGRTFYVAPNGLPTNRGNQTSPWDLQTALNNRQSLIKAGDIVFLRGGLYKGTFVSNLVGSPGNPITVSSAPGEWAVIDDNQTLFLYNSIDTGIGAITLSGDINLPDKINIVIDGEYIELSNRTGNTFTHVVRGVNKTSPVPHEAGSPVRAASEILTIKGADVVFKNFEVTDSHTERIVSESGSHPLDFTRRFGGISIYAPQSKVINTVVHDTGQGISFWLPAVDSEVYGNIIYNNGEEAPDRGHGHGIYSQNNDGIKTIDDNIIFGNLGGYGIHIYGSSNAFLRGYSISGNVNIFNRWLIGGGAPSDNITLTNNFLYATGFQLGYSNKNNGSIKVLDNYVYTTDPVQLSYWNQVVMTGNNFYQNGNPTRGRNVAIKEPPNKDVLSNYQINNNNYIFSRTSQEAAFTVEGNGASTNSSNFLNFEKWKSLGFDTNGTWRGATEANSEIVKATGVNIFYRPNKYEQGRANVVIYNFDKSPSVSIDLSKTGLKPGQRFEIRNGENFNASAVATGTFANQLIKIDLSGLQIAQPWGDATKHNNETCPQFCVFVVIPK